MTSAETRRARVAAALPLTTDRLRLRPLTHADLDAMFRVLGDRESMRYYPNPFGLEETRAWIDRCLERRDRDGITLWAVERRDDGRFLGDCGLIIQDPTGRPEIEVAYHFERAHQGQGYATEAAEACLRLAFETLSADEVIALIRPENEPSRGVARRLGMTVRERVDWKGLVHDIFSIPKPGVRSRALLEKPVVEPAELSVLAHWNRSVANPLPLSILEQGLDRLGPLEGARVLDIGCGKGWWLGRLIERGAAFGQGLDLELTLLDRARQALAGRPASLLRQDGRTFRPARPFDLASCVGSSHALADHMTGALARLHTFVKPGGRLVLGEGYWRHAPTDAYLEALGATRDELPDGIDALTARVEGAGWRIDALFETPEADFAGYEAAWSDSLEALAKAGHPAAAQLREAAGAARQRNGLRDASMGFALILARRALD